MFPICLQWSFWQRQVRSSILHSPLNWGRTDNRQHFSTCKIIYTLVPQALLLMLNAPPSQLMRFLLWLHQWRCSQLVSDSSHNRIFPSSFASLFSPFRTFSRYISSAVWDSDIQQGWDRKREGPRNFPFTFKERFVPWCILSKQKWPMCSAHTNSTRIFLSFLVGAQACLTCNWPPGFPVIVR